MARVVTVGAAQLGPIQKAESRESVVERLCALMEKAHRRGVQILVYPELALTTFFPRWYMADWAEVDRWFESALPSNTTAPLFAAARRYGIGFHLGYAELTQEADETGKLRTRRFNTAVMVSPAGEVLLKYRKIHLPGHAEFEAQRHAQHLEKRYFEVGNLGWPVRRIGWDGIAPANMGLMICNDRRWPEAWRVMGLQNVELVMLGYNTPALNTTNAGHESPHLRVEHSHLSVRAGAYQNATWAVAVAKAGNEDGHELFGSSIIVNPQGQIVAEASSWQDELIVADADLDLCRLGKTTIFNFAAHRRPEHYGMILDRVGARDPD
ncbi:MAG: N-carbamoyl-D-amino-acid hydrolase [Alphaproteobacteria bacterium]|nr:N-carbamoyl-D-amino-acid hydrolase [Alphaproteobacteria bacterium]